MTDRITAARALESVTAYLARRTVAKGFDLDVIHTFDAGCAENIEGIQLRASHIEALTADRASLLDALAAAEAREAALLSTNETERQTLVRHNAAHAAQVADLTAKVKFLDALDVISVDKVADLTAKLEVAYYVLQDDLNNLLTPRVVDVAYTAWQLGRAGINKDDGGPCDWFNDTRPEVMDGIAAISAAIKPVGA